MADLRADLQADLLVADGIDWNAGRAGRGELDALVVPWCPLQESMIQTITLFKLQFAAAI